MAVEETFEDDRVSGLALEAYGDTQQEKAYFDENGDLYLICLMKGSNYKPGGPIPECVIIRMKAERRKQIRVICSSLSRILTFLS